MLALVLLVVGLTRTGFVNLADVDATLPPEYVSARGFPIAWLLAHTPSDLRLAYAPRIYPYGLIASSAILYLVSLVLYFLLAALRAWIQRGCSGWRAA